MPRILLTSGPLREALEPLLREVASHHNAARACISPAGGSVAVRDRLTSTIGWVVLNAALIATSGIPLAGHAQTATAPTLEQCKNDAAAWYSKDADRAYALAAQISQPRSPEPN
jgi:hypothetical protein